MEGRGLSSAGVRHDDRVDIFGVGVSPINLDCKFAGNSDPLRGIIASNSDPF
jgi:hypothetical protein